MIPGRGNGAVAGVKKIQIFHHHHMLARKQDDAGGKGEHHRPTNLHAGQIHGIGTGIFKFQKLRIALASALGMVMNFRKR